MATSIENAEKIIKDKSLAEEVNNYFIYSKAYNFSRLEKYLKAGKWYFKLMNH